MRARKSLASQAQEEAEVVAGGGEDKRLSRVVARDREVVQVPLEYAVHPRRGLRDGSVQSFAQFHLDRLERRSSGGANLPACRRPYPPDGRGLMPGI